MPFEPHIPYIACFFLLDIVVPDPIDPYLSVISSLIPSFVAEFLIFLLRTYLLMSPIKMIWSPLLFQVIMSSDKSDRKSVLGYSCLFRLAKLVSCWVYTEPGPHPAAGGTGL